MKKRSIADLKKMLDQKVNQYNHIDFIANDPIKIPHQFTRIQDIEIAGFFAALFAWGNRTIIINKSTELMTRMDNEPYKFITQHSDRDLQRLLEFKHRTFNATDILYMVDFLKRHYAKNESLESAFFPNEKIKSVKEALIHFKKYFSDASYFPSRTSKHIATPESNSHCKRLNMFLRWMVRKDDAGVDFGIWKKIDKKKLIMPIDVHVYRVATELQLLNSKKIDWNAAEELTNYLKKLDPSDPVKYDYALFSIGINNKKESLI